MPKIDALLKLATDHVAKVLPKSKIGQALSYFLGLNPYINNYVYHATARMDNNVAERALRPVAIGRKMGCLWEVKKEAKTQRFI